MAVNIQYKGTDLASIYEAKLGAAGANVNFLSASSDIANSFTALTSVSQANGNLGSRVPPTGILTTTGTDLSSVFAGAAGMYSITSVLSPAHANFSSPATLTHTFTVTFASGTALNNYFTYGGRITIAPSQSAGTPADADLQLMFTQIGTIVIYDQGNYITGAGAGVVLNSPTKGGNTTTGTLDTLITATEQTTYTSNTYIVRMQLTSANVLTISAILTLVTHGTIADSYTGTYTSSIGQRNYSAGGGIGPSSAQTAPTFTTTVAP